MAESPDHPLLKRAKIARAVLVARARAGQMPIGQAHSIDLPRLDSLLTRFANLHPRPALVAVMRLFGQNTDEEIAVALNVNLRTVKREWHLARAWIAGEHGGSEPLGVRVPVTNSPKNPSSPGRAKQDH